ncbi:MAG: hypothetical protein H7829_11595 [Magnetococcus sp. THC-1_WYH]
MNRPPTYSLQNDSSGLFEISGTTLRLKPEARADYESASEHAVTIRATDRGGAAYDQVVIITVVNKPEINLSQQNVQPAIAAAPPSPTGPKAPFQGSAAEAPITAALSGNTAFVNPGQAPVMSSLAAVGPTNLSRVGDAPILSGLSNIHSRPSNQDGFGLTFGTGSSPSYTTASLVTAPTHPGTSVGTTSVTSQPATAPHEAAVAEPGAVTEPVVDEQQDQGNPEAAPEAVQPAPSDNQPTGDGARLPQGIGTLSQQLAEWVKPSHADPLLAAVAELIDQNNRQATRING